MLKLFTLAAILSVNLICVSAEAPRLTRSNSDTFYLAGIAITAHDAARRAEKPLKVELNGFVPEIDLDGTKHEITSAEYLAILQTNDFATLAAQRQVLPKHDPRHSKIAADLDALGKALRAKEAPAARALIDKQKAKISQAQTVLNDASADAAHKERAELAVRYAQASIAAATSAATADQKSSCRLM